MGLAHPKIAADDATYVITEKGWMFESFEKDAEKIKRDQDLILASTESAISSKKTNGRLVVTGALSVIVAAATCVYIAFTFYKDAVPNLQPINKQLERTWLSLDSLRQSQVDIDSAVRQISRRKK